MFNSSTVSALSRSKVIAEVVSGIWSCGAIALMQMNWNKGK